MRAFVRVSSERLRSVMSAPTRAPPPLLLLLPLLLFVALVLVPPRLLLLRPAVNRRVDSVVRSDAEVRSPLLKDEADS